MPAETEVCNVTLGAGRVWGMCKTVSVCDNLYKIVS